MHPKIRVFTLILLLSLGAYSAQAQYYNRADQKTFEVSFGLGFPDLLHAGMKYRLTDVSKIGMSYGTLIFADRSNNRSMIAITLEHEYHFPPSNQKKHKYYLSQKLTYIQDADAFTQSRILYFTPSVGKVFYSEGPFGINIDAGLNVKINNKTFGSMQDDQVSPNNFPAIFPAVRLQFFFQL